MSSPQLFDLYEFDTGSRHFLDRKPERSDVEGRALRGQCLKIIENVACQSVIVIAFLYTEAKLLVDGGYLHPS